MAACSLVPYDAEDVAALRLVTSLALVERQVKNAIIISVFIAMAILLFTVMSGLYFVRGIVVPLGQVERIAASIARGELDVRLPVTGDERDEVDRLRGTINQMAEGLEETEKMKNEFISSVSHELRTPLTAINGWAETLAADPGANPEQTQRGLNIIVKESRRLTTMVEELLDFTRMQDGRFTLRVEETDLLAELEDAIFTYREIFSREGIELRYECADDLPPIIADGERMKQVFCNVLDNAAKHGGSGKRIDVSVAAENGSMVIRVRDFGPGIPVEELPYVKQKFYKGSSKARGSGIGLAVCDEIMRLHNGTFDIANASGGGAVVTMTLPMEK